MQSRQSTPQRKSCLHCRALENGQWPRSVGPSASNMRNKSCAKTLAGTVKEILGTAKSVGCTVEGEDPQDVQESIDAGDIEIPEK